MKRLIFTTGLPRIGKTTVLTRTAEKLKVRGYKLGGMISQEIREANMRVGFEILDYASRRKGWLAHVRQPKGPRIGKYRVNLHDLNSVGVTAILSALKHDDIVLIDEIGPMELFSDLFKDVLYQVFKSSKPVLGTIHFHAQNQLIRQIKSRKDADIIEVTLENRVNLPVLIVDKIINLGYEKNS